MWTDRWDGRMYSNISALLAILIDSDALIMIGTTNVALYYIN